jgi:ribonucleoside-diphosphate reductase alpha chain
MADPNYAKLTSMHFYAWKKGLKTGCYYLRTKAPVAAQKFTVDPRFMEALNQKSVDLSGVSSPEHSDESDTESIASKPETREQKMERLVREYEEEVAKARASAEAGEGCLQCSS